MSIHPDFIAELNKHFRGEIRTDLASRILYSTDASIYQIEPTGVLLPRTQEDLHAAVELAARHGIPILPRGAGTSLAGQAIGPALILDCSRWLDNIVEIDPDARTAVVEPGVVLGALNRALTPHGLQFGPDPASAERATMGGVIANNATGAHSIVYGMAADHILGSDVILSDGSLDRLTWTDPETPSASNAAGARAAAIRSAVATIQREYAGAIKSAWPRVWRNSAGYRLNYLLPWSPSSPPQWAGATYPANNEGQVNLAALLAGSEGTLAVIRRATLNLVPRPACTILGVLAFESVPAACDAVPDLLAHQPSAIELVPQILIRLARTVPAYASQMSWVLGDPAALLVLEFSGENPDALRRKVRALTGLTAVAESAEEQTRVWNVRRVGLGLLDSRVQSARPAAFMEDCAIPVERLGEFVRAVERILAEHDTQAGFYAHASAGCLHIRPILDLKTRRGVADLRSISAAVHALTMKLGGAMSSEHGDGLARGEWLEPTYGREAIAAMQLLKDSADPDHLLNPGKILDAPRLDAALRYGADYRAGASTPAISFGDQDGLALAIEQCNGQGVCRKSDGVMCPSYQATREEMHSTRGRANLLRAMIAPRGPNAAPSTEPVRAAVAEALDLCLACKGCKAECPSGVDMAKLKFAFEAEYYKSHLRPPRDYLFGYFHVVASVLAPIAGIINPLMQNQKLARAAARALRLAPQRPLPKFSSRRARPARRRGRRAVILLPDPLTHFVEPHVEDAAFVVLEAFGLDVHVLPVIGAGASLMSKGFLPAAARHARAVLMHLERLDPRRMMPVLGLEPAEIYTLKHDFSDLLPARAVEIAERSSKTWLLEEFLVREQQIPPLRVATNQEVLFHPHCHQHAEGPARDGLPSGTHATLRFLRSCGFDARSTEAGCCGLAGAFGYKAEHYEISQRIGELKLYPAVRQRGSALIASTGASCRTQITHATGVTAEHPIVLAARALQNL